MKKVICILFMVLLVFISFDISYSNEKDPNSKPIIVQNILPESDFDKDVKVILTEIQGFLYYIATVHDQNIAIIEKDNNDIIEKIDRLQFRLDILEGKINNISKEGS
jgi:peptidoglycan hydrolase CwlO-like protein